MPAVQVGQRVYVPIASGNNGGVNFAVGHITEVVDDDGPNDSAICNVSLILNRALTALDLGEFLTDIPVFVYENQARGAGALAGAWLPDWA